MNIVLPAVVRQFKQLFPQVELILKRMQTLEQVEALNNRQIDLGLLHPPINNETLNIETIYRENLIAALPDNHFLAKDTSDSISLQQLVNESFILFPRYLGSVLYDRIINTCQQAGFSPKIVQEAIPQQTILGLVAAEIGISLIHSSARNLSRDKVIFKDLIEPTPILETAIAWSSNASNPVLPSFLKIVRQNNF